jgi:serine/threonine protein kinase
LNTENWQKLNELFAEALTLTLDERAALVASIADRELKSELESLLSAHESANRFLSRNAVELNAKTLLDREAEKLAGKQIGQFKIVRELGRGGMGAVYLAERAGADFTQKAALKLIKRGMDTDFIIRRFQTERRILSRLSHPLIARLLDGGTTADGLPYFVMEYVEGRNLKEFCREEFISNDAKLKLFRQICEAVAFAHRNLVIHRDLKPSNIIITEDGSAKLLDFGIAKVLDADETGSEKTKTEFRLMTPKYASPEQLRGELVSTQSDVFSLGVLLDEILSINDNPQSAIRNPQSNAELRTIINKATHEEIVRRYASVEQLAEDIRRFQGNLPILAQGDGFAYRTQKFIKRHRFGVLAASLILLTLFGGMSATFWQFRRANAERRLAEQRFDDVRALANSVIFELHDEIQTLPGSTKARKLLVEKALEYLSKLEADAETDANLEHEIAMAYLKIADVQGQVFEASLLETDEAEKNYRKALQILEKSVAAQPSNFEFRRDLALACYRFAEALRGGNDLTEALALEKRSADLFEPLTREKPEDMDTRRRWLVARSGLADVLKETGEFARSIPLYEQNIKDTEEAVRLAPNDLKLNRFLAIAYGGYAGVLWVTGDSPKALEFILKSQTVTNRLSAENPDDTDLLRNVGVVSESVVRIASDLANNALVEPNAKTDIDVMEKISRGDAENMEAKYDVASAHNNYADFLEKNDRWKEAFEHRQKVLEAILPLEKKENNPELYTADFFEFFAKFARAAAKSGKPELALKYCAKAEGLDFRIEKTSVETQNLYANDFVALGDAFTNLGDRDKARAWYKKAVETWQSLQTSGKFYPNQTKNLAAAAEKLK